MGITELKRIVDEYYPRGISLNDPEILHNKLFKKVSDICLKAHNNQGQWANLLQKARKKFTGEITEFVLLKELNPSFIAVFITEEYQRPKSENYEPCQLILKISVLAPVYSIYFDNFVSTHDKRIIRCNPITEIENTLLTELKKTVKETFSTYSHLDISMAFHMLPHLSDISLSNKRKPFLDECIFGLYLSIHPYNYNEDKLNK